MICKELEEHLSYYGYSICEIKETEPKEITRKKYRLSDEPIDEMNNPSVVKILEKINSGGGFVPITVSNEKLKLKVAPDGWLYEMMWTDKISNTESVRLYFELKSCLMIYTFDKNTEITLKTAGTGL